MQMLDTNGDFGDVVLDPARKIPKAHLDKVCKIYQGEKCCRYIHLGIKGFVCVKNSGMEAAMTEMALSGMMKAKGDNCDGMCGG